jgi:hypothetical protein
MAILETIRVSKNKSIQWISLNPILGFQEIGVEVDTKLFKVGDGIHRYSELGYVLSGYQNALFISISDDPNNFIGLSTEGELFIDKNYFNALDSYQAGKEHGATAVTPADEYQCMVLKIGQDFNLVNTALATLANRVSVVEGKEVGDKIDDDVEGQVTTWSSEKIADKILVSINALKADITSNPDGAYDALVRLADFLENNDSVALTMAEELALSVRKDEQELTLAEQSQVRTNIGALAASEMGDASTYETFYVAGLADADASQFKESEM